MPSLEWTQSEKILTILYFQCKSIRFLCISFCWEWLNIIFVFMMVFIESLLTQFSSFFRFHFLSLTHNPTQFMSFFFLSILSFTFLIILLSVNDFFFLSVFLSLNSKEFLLIEKSFLISGTTWRAFLHAVASGVTEMVPQSALFQYRSMGHMLTSALYNMYTLTRVCVCVTLYIMYT